MAWMGWALAAMGFMGQAHLGMKAAFAVGILNANFTLVALLALFLFRERLQPSKLMGLATTLSGLWLMAR